MKKVVLPAIIALAVSASGALAADLGGKMVTKAPPPPPSPWDLAFGASFVTDYVFRGITQSNHKPGVSAYIEPRYNVTKDLQFYVGMAGESISFPNRAAAEIDFYGGFRPTFGALALDFGAWYYWYPGGQCYNPTIPGECAINGAVNTINGNVAKKDASFFEVYAKGTYTFNPNWAVGANFYYTPNYVNTGAEGEYLSGTLKYTGDALPNGWGWYVSGEFGRQWLGNGDSFYAVPIGLTSVPYADYNTWNVGIGFTYKVFTVDLRYSDTNLNKGDCNAITSDFTTTSVGSITAANPAPGYASKWCGAAFIGKLGFDLTLDSLK